MFCFNNKKERVSLERERVFILEVMVCLIERKLFKIKYHVRNHKSRKNNWWRNKSRIYDIKMKCFTIKGRTVKRSFYPVTHAI